MIFYIAVRIFLGTLGIMPILMSLETIVDVILEDKTTLRVLEAIAQVIVLMTGFVLLEIFAIAGF